MAGKKARAKASKPPKTDKAAFCKQFSTFELKPSPNKGIGAFATKAMPAGTSFHRETALIVFTKPQWLISSPDVAKAYRQLSDPDKTIFDTARHDTDHPQNCKCKMGVLAFTQFIKKRLLPCNALPNRKSFFNHSCSANTILLSHARRQPPEHPHLPNHQGRPGRLELTFSYTSRFHFSTHALAPALARSQKLPTSYAFALTANHHLPHAISANMRRILLRHLHFRLLSAISPPQIPLQNPYSPPSLSPNLVKKPASTPSSATRLPESRSKDIISGNPIPTWRTP